MKDLKTFTSISYACSLQAIPLSEITPRYDIIDKNDVLSLNIT
jgi:hypothetical protein